MAKAVRPGSARCGRGRPRVYDTMMSLVVLAVIALVLGAVALWRRGERLRAGLMVVAALVIAGNIAIWIQ
jgi:hypothetical protein